jgi:hypothetical protein
MLVRNNHSAPLGLPGQSVALGGVELQPGDNDIDAAVWAEAAKAAQVQAWIKAKTVVVDEAPKPKKS